MKKLLELLGIILITSNAAGPLIANKPNNNKAKIKNSLETLTRQKRQAPKKSVNKKDNPTKGSTPKPQNEQPDIIEKEINLDENYSDNIQKMLQELIDENYIDPLRSINMGGLISKELDNKTIISKLEELEPKMANWIEEWQNNKEKILILTLKNSNNKSIKLVINLNNLYLLGFINNQNHYFYFDDELLEKIKQHNQEEIAKLNNLKNKLNKLKENKFLFNEEKVKEYLQEKNKLIPLKEKEKNIKKLNYNNELNSLNKKLSNLQGENLKKDENEIKSINAKVSEKCSIKEEQKHNLGYTGAYTSDGLNVVIKENGKPDKGKNINISKDSLNDAILNLSNYDNNKQNNQTIKDDLVRMIFITSEAMRFQCDEKTLEIFANIKNIDEFKKIIFESKNILKAVQKIIDNKYSQNSEDTEINWKDYTSQLRGDWKKYSEQFNKFRIEIWEELIKLKNINDFIFNEKEDLINNLLDKILEVKNSEQKIKEVLISWFDKKAKANNDLKNIKNDFVNETKNFIKVHMNPLNLKILNNLSSDFTNEQNIIKKQQEIFPEINQNFKTKNDVEKLDQEVKTEITNIINNISNNNTSLLCSSITQNNLDITKLLLMLNSNLEVINGYWANLSPLHYGSYLGNIEIVKELLKYPNIKVNILDNNGNGKNTPLNYAIIMNNIEIVKELLTNQNSKNKIKVNSMVEGDLLPLYYAAFFGYTEIVKLLLDAGANVNVTNNNGFNAFHIATLQGHDKIAKLLIEKAKEIYKDKLEEFKKFINAKDKNGLSPLLYTRKNNNVEIVRLLLDNEVDLNIKNKNDNTILHLTIWENNFTVAKELLTNQNSKNKINVNAINNYENTPIMGAIQNNNIEIVKLLLNHRDIDINKTNKDGFSPLDIASQKGYEKVKNLLNNFNELNKKIKLCNNLLQNTQDEEQKTKINNSLKENQDKLKKLLKIELSDVVTQTKLGEISNSQEQTILNRIRELNSNLDINQVKVQENSITN